jgi:hypothetical protein
MAVQIMLMSVPTFLGKAGVDAQLVEWVLSTPGVSAKLLPNEFSLSSPGAGVQKQPLKLEYVLELKKGTMPAAAKQALRTMLDVMISTAKAKYVTPPEAPEPEQPANFADKMKSAVSGVAALPPLTSSPAEKLSKWPKFDLSQLQTAPCTPLRDAHALYQPVAGTSPGSRYFLVAGTEDLRVAARLLHGKLSVRVEGDGLSEHVSKFTAAGFALSHKGGNCVHVSMHLEVGGDLSAARKALGAILLGTGIEFETPYPDLGLVASVGS